MLQADRKQSLTLIPDLSADGALPERMLVESG
jgi:hypothetical protein